MAWKVILGVAKRVFTNIYALLLIGGVIVYNLVRKNRTLSTDRKRLQDALGRLHEIYQMDDADVCSKLGGLRQQCDGLRSGPADAGDK